MCNHDVPVVLKRESTTCGKKEKDKEIKIFPDPGKMTNGHVLFDSSSKSTLKELER